MELMLLILETCTGEGVKDIYIIQHGIFLDKENLDRFSLGYGDDNGGGGRGGVCSEMMSLLYCDYWWRVMSIKMIARFFFINDGTNTATG